MSTNVRPSHAWRRWRVALAIAGGIVALMALIVFSVVPLSSDTARARVIAVLADRLDSDVDLEDLRLRLFPKLSVEGQGLKIRHKGRRDVPPLISIEQFSVQGSVANLLRKHVSRVTVKGLDIQIPPDRNRDTGESGRESEQPGRHGTDDANRQTERTIVIDELVSNDGRLTIIPHDRNKAPKVWRIHRLRMHAVGIDQRMPFEATLTNATPPGEIATTGYFGPWHAEEPGGTPLEGTFNFDKADLSVFKGISGILSAHGTYAGTLGRIDIHGETATPQFRVTAAGQPVPLHATYHAVVDGTNGNTFLDPVNASFLNTSLVAKGAVIDMPGKTGRTVKLDVTMKEARLEDVLKLAVKASKPPMVGALTLKTNFELPPGDQDVVRRLRLAGQFGIQGTRFTDPGVQKRINELSRRSNPKTDQDVRRVASNFNGTFRLSGGTLRLPDLTCV
jgi:uncharacterized protein involved in outer membrane biogenesis